MCNVADDGSSEGPWPAGDEVSRKRTGVRASMQRAWVRRIVPLEDSKGRDATERDDGGFGTSPAAFLRALRFGLRGSRGPPLGVGKQRACG